MKTEETDEIAAYLLGKAAANGSSKGAVDAVAATLMGIESALMPILGERGVAALYKRAVHLASEKWPWLPKAETAASTSMGSAALILALEQQTAADAAAASAELLQTLYALLTTLIGASLTERLLRTVWATFLSGRSAQDDTS